MHNNLDDEMKVHLKQEDSKKKKKKKRKKSVITFMIMIKNSYKNIRKKERKLYLIACVFVQQILRKLRPLYRDHVMKSTSFLLLQNVD